MTFLIRIAPDITLKAPRTRARFTQRLIANLRQALADEKVSATLTRDHSRIYLDSSDPRAPEICRRIFGIHSLSPCIDEPAGDLDALIARGAEIFHSEVRGKTFAVRARVRERRPFDGMEINRRLGAVLAAEGTVDLTSPEVTASIEVRNGRVRYFSQRIDGPGGLPVGTESRGVALISGGFDSAVAAWRMLRRGVALDYLFCRLGGRRHERDVLEVANHLARTWSGGTRPRIFMIPFEDVVEVMMAEVKESFRQLVLKRLMYRLAGAVALMTRADVLVTGEALGQVSSQTTRNLRALGGVPGLPVLRPLLTFDKEEIIEQARRIGTYDLCAGVKEYCAIVPKQPATAARASALRREEEKVEFDEVALAHEAVRMDLPAPLPVLSGEEAWLEKIPPDAVVIDLRPDTSAKRAPIDGAVRVSADDLARLRGHLDKSRLHVVVCDMGLRSAWATEWLAEAGVPVRRLAPAGVEGLARSISDNS